MVGAAHMFRDMATGRHQGGAGHFGQFGGPGGGPRWNGGGGFGGGFGNPGLLNGAQFGAQNHHHHHAHHGHGPGRCNCCG